MKCIPERYVDLESAVLGALECGQEMDPADPGLESRAESTRNHVRQSGAGLKFSYIENLIPPEY
jgi:hypothetical protein